MNDKEGRKWLLQKLYESKYRYIFRADNHKLYVTISKPVSVDGVYYKQADCGLTMRLMSAICPLFDDVRSFISIPEELGIVDWSKVSKDTPILVSNDNKEWKRRYFAQYKNGKVVAYGLGATSWSSGCILRYWDYAKLAGGDDEN